MKKLLLFSLCLGGLVSTVFAEAPSESNTTSAAPTVANTIKIITRPEIVGLWGMEIPENKQCIEYYNFKGENQIAIKSGLEWSTGIYEYQPDQAGQQGISALLLQVQHDNNQMDCSGRKEDQSGELSQYFVKWKNSQTIDFCATEKGDQCFATLHRVLP